jgi:hypothetical protein
MRTLFAAVVLSASLLLPSTSSAQRSASSGFFFGLGMEGSAIRGNEAQSVTESGGGGDLTLGYGFGKHWSMYGDVSGAAINADGGGSYSLGHADLGMRVHFRSGPNIVVPFLQAGVTGRAISEDFQGSRIVGNGAGFSVGAGLNAHFTPKVALSGAVTWTGGSFTHFTVDGAAFDNPSFDATSARVQLGLVWFPGAR